MLPLFSNSAHASRARCPLAPNWHPSQTHHPVLCSCMEHVAKARSNASECFSETYWYEPTVGSASRRFDELDSNRMSKQYYTEILFLFVDILSAYLYAGSCSSIGFHPSCYSSLRPVIVPQRSMKPRGRSTRVDLGVVNITCCYQYMELRSSWAV